MKNNTQRNAILKHLKTHKCGITSKDAIDLYGCTRLSAVIAALEEKGNRISHKREVVAGRYGNVSVTRYILEV